MANTKGIFAKDVALKLRAIAKETDTVDEVYKLTGLSPETIKKEVTSNTFKAVTRALSHYARRQFSSSTDVSREALTKSVSSFTIQIQNNLLSKKGGSSAFDLVEPIYIGDQLFKKSEELTDAIVAKAFLVNGSVASRFIKPKKEDGDSYKITLDGETPIEGDVEEIEEVGDQAIASVAKKSASSLKEQAKEQVKEDSSDDQSSEVK